MRHYLIMTAVFGGLSVALGAFGAHALEGSFSPYQQSIWHKAVLYQMFHTFALGLTALLACYKPGRLLTYAAGLFCMGIVLFSGSLYTLAWSEISRLGMVTPFGGVSLLLGWGALGLHAWHVQPARS